MTALADASAPRALDATFYTDPAVYAQTIDRIFRREWNYVCHQSEIPKAGDYCAFSLVGQDFFVIRGRDEQIRCFHNVCQHRGHTLVENTGRATVLVCPYHAWSYELDGRLRAAPGAKFTPGFDRSEICLTELKVDTLLGFVFVNFDHGAPPLAERYPGVVEAATALCPDVERRVFAHEHSAQESCNWLVAVENYNECYHCGHVHKAFSDGVIDPSSYDIQPFGPGNVLRHTSKAATGDSQWYAGAVDDYGSFYLFPSFSLQIYPGGLVNTYSWRPLAVDDVEVRRGWLSKDGAVDDRLQQVIDLDRDTTFAEDLSLVKAVQRGLSSEGYRPGPLIIAPEGGIDSEHSIAALHRWVREALA